MLGGGNDRQDGAIISLAVAKGPASLLLVLRSSDGGRDRETNTPRIQRRCLNLTGDLKWGGEKELSGQTGSKGEGITKMRPQEYYLSESPKIQGKGRDERGMVHKTKTLAS